MSTSEAERIGRAWLAAGAPWADGMLDGASGDRAIVASNGCACLLRVDGIDSGAERIPPVAWPDPRDAATVGAMLGVVRAAWGDPRAHLIADDGSDEWWWWAYEDIHDGGPTDAEALIAAWNARPTGGSNG